jgi:hypothetical protein
VVDCELPYPTIRLALLSDDDPTGTYSDMEGIVPGKVNGV